MEDYFSTYLGTWEVRRKVVDHLEGSTVTFTGKATITLTRFDEAGEVRHGPTVLNATRAYRLRLNRRSVTVTHPDGSPFIVLRLQPAQTVRHPCGADLYIGRFFFLDMNKWAETWRVTGPRKRYTCVSHYRRLAG